MKKRGSGILLHITSLPSPFGIGDMGPWAYKFADFLMETKQSFWQMLPLNPTELYHGNSPYHSTSAFACNPLFISLELLVKEGLIAETDLKSEPEFPKDRVDYPSVVTYKVKLFEGAYERFKGKKEAHEYEQFCMEHAHWLDDFALFMALRSRFQGKVWSEWPQEIRDREPGSLESAKMELYERLDRTRFLQYIFFKQWISLKKYCNERGVQILGDIPIYVNYDSADLWTHPELFKLDHDKRPYAVAGVPPDYFSETGQLWGNPIYRWDVLKERGYDWWIQRMKQNFKFFDLVRIDHFRGFVAYWEVPANEKTAKNGKWVEAPAEDFFKVLLEKFPAAPLIAEDLGIITPEVREIMQRFDFPGMKVLLFAFGEDLPTNPYAPHNVVQNCLIYTGTHDNNTARGWFENEATPEEKKRLFLYLGRQIPAGEIHHELIRLAMTSVANTAILPMQDILGLGEEARMNRPSTKDGNWQYRLLQEAVTPDLAGRLREMTEIYGRA